MIGCSDTIKLSGDDLPIKVTRAPRSTGIRRAAKFAEALVKGTPNRGKIALTILEDKVRELI